MSHDNVIASLMGQLERLNERVSDLEARQQPDIRIQENPPKSKRLHTVWISNSYTEVGKISNVRVWDGENWV